MGATVPAKAPQIAGSPAAPTFNALAPRYATMTGRLPRLGFSRTGTPIGRIWK